MWASQVYNWCLKLRLVALENDLQPTEVDVRSRMRITPELLTKYGFTRDCEGCRYKNAGLTGHKAHTEKCCQRIMEAMGNDEFGKALIQK